MPTLFPLFSSRQLIHSSGSCHEEILFNPSVCSFRGQWLLNCYCCSYFITRSIRKKVWCDSSVTKKMPSHQKNYTWVRDLFQRSRFHFITPDDFYSSTLIAAVYRQNKNHVNKVGKKIFQIFLIYVVNYKSLQHRC